VFFPQLTNPAISGLTHPKARVLNDFIRIQETTIKSAGRPVAKRIAPAGNWTSILENIHLPILNIDL